MSVLAEAPTSRDSEEAASGFSELVGVCLRLKLSLLRTVSKSPWSAGWRDAVVVNLGVLLNGFVGAEGVWEGGEEGVDVAGWFGLCSLPEGLLGPLSDDE